MRSPLAEIFMSTAYSTCLVRKTIGFDMNGQPSYGDVASLKCRIAPIGKRQVLPEGDIQTDTGYMIILDPDADVYTGDLVEVPELGLNPVIAQCRYGKDIWGYNTHIEVTIL